MSAFTLHVQVTRWFELVSRLEDLTAEEKHELVKLNHYILEVSSHIHNKNMLGEL